jgi:excisionase family DNA binding protein
MVPRWLTLRQAAAYCSLSESTLRRACRERRLYAHRLGRLLRFERAHLDAFLTGTPLGPVAEAAPGADVDVLE